MNVGGRSCLVTGAAGGIGRATAIEAARRGAKLVITDIQPDALEATAEAIRSRGDTVLYVAPVDLTNRDAVQSFARDVHDRHGSVDVVMNVAGTSLWGPVERLSESHWRRMVEVNLMGPIHVIEAFMPAMVAAGRGGHLVNVSSAAGLLGLPWHAAYSAGKFGLRGISEVLRFDLRRHRIGVTLVCPGGVDTPLVDSMEIVGVDRTHPVMRKMNAQFRRHAKSPEFVARRILDAVERNRYLVYTSPDIRALHLLQRVFPPAYELVMRVMNRQMVRVAQRTASDT